MTEEMYDKLQKVLSETADEIRRPHSHELQGQQVEKFQENGFWGIKDMTGKVVLSTKYDQIEFCADFVYAHYEQRHTFFYKSGGSSDCCDQDDDYHFYENGKVGLNDCEGKIVFPAAYDEIDDWGKDCDVVYVRDGKDWHYFTHNHEEILTDVESMECDAYPEMPYCLGEDQNREVLLCVEPIDTKEGNRDCYAYNQWVRLSRIPRSQIRSIFESCDILPFPTEEIGRFEDKDTYIYSARKCSAKGAMPITQCIEKFKTLGVYDVSWHYMLKISVNHNTAINPHDLYNAIRHFQDIEDRSRLEIGIAHDDTLEDGEIEVFQVHYFWDDMGAFLDDTFIQEMLPESPVEEIKDYIEGLSAKEREKRTYDAILEVEYSERREWKETTQVLEYLNEVGPNRLNNLVWKVLWFNTFWMEKITPEEWGFKRNVIIWAKDHGASINCMRDSKSMIEALEANTLEAEERRHEGVAAQESLKNAFGFLEWFKSLGPMSASDIQKTVESRIDGLSPVEVLEVVRTL